MTTPAVITRLFDWKVRGVRWIEIIGAVCVAAMILSVYIAKAGAARESSQIGELEGRIAENRQRVRLLNAEIARLEQPARLEALSRAAGLAPVDVHRQATEAQLPQLKAEPAPAQTSPALAASAPTPVVAAPAVGGVVDPAAEGLPL